ncbi:MAG: VWA domain-containing protein [Lachnospiraceae bacterium]|nr:VWA domain-containing protein [Lachnospiraceae bacterium]
MKRGLKIGIICGASVIGVAIITLVTIALIKTSSFKDSLTDFTDKAAAAASMKAYENDYQTLVNDATDASDYYKFWTYGDYEDKFTELLGQADEADRKTTAFRGSVAELKTKFDALYSLGKYKSDVDSEFTRAEGYARDFKLDMYDKSLKNLETLLASATDVNKKMAKYVIAFKESTEKLNGSAYILGDLEGEFNEAKNDAKKAIEEFDESKVSKAVARYAKLIDQILENTQKLVTTCKDNADDLVDHAIDYGYSEFDKTMVNNLRDRVKEAAESEDYARMEEEYANLTSWIDDTDAALFGYAENTLKWVQADVSDDDSVKLYMSSTADDSYDLKLEDFVVYENDGGNWNERKATDISQIRGMMSIDLVADVSSSMWDDFYTMQCAVESFINSTSSDTKLGLSTIGTIYERHQTMTGNKEMIRNSLWSLNCDGLTSLYQSLYSSVVYTASQTGSRCVVAFTDGDNVPYGTGYDYSAQDVIDVSKYYQVPVYIIGIGYNVNSYTLRNIAESTGGLYFENIGVSKLADVYAEIYEKLGRLYALTYLTDMANDVSRTIYVRYTDIENGMSAVIDGVLEAETLQDAYHASDIDGSDVLSYYTETSYLSSDDLLKLGDSLDKLQTIINIYFAHYGYKFSTDAALDKMISLGVIKKNGKLDNDSVLKKMKNDKIVYQNLSALFNFRYEMIFKVASQLYYSNPGISYDQMRVAVHEHFGESNQNRFSYDVKAAWSALH